MSSSINLPTIKFVDDEGNVYLLVSDGPGTQSGVVLRLTTDPDGIVWQQLGHDEAEMILMQYVMHELERRTANEAPRSNAEPGDNPA